MKVEELIEKLSKLNPKHKVYLYNNDYCEWTLLQEIQVGEFEPNYAYDYNKLDKKKPTANGVGFL